MDLKVISSFIKVADLGSFSKAAAVVGVNQPTIGKQIKKLEQECGSALFHRNGRGVILTQEGHKLVNQLRPLICDMEGVISSFRASGADPAGEVSVALPPTIMQMLGYDIFHLITTKYPRIKLNIVTGYSGYIYEWLMNARVDVAVLHDSRRAKHILATPLIRLPLSLVSAPKILRKVDFGLAVNFKELDGMPLVLASHNHGLRRSVESAAEREGMKLNIAYEVDSFDLMKEITIRGEAHTILAQGGVLKELKNDTLVAREIKNPSISTKLVLATASNRPRTSAVKAVEEVIVRVMQDNDGAII
jgi:LysR family nitrogen assimilation transcriptional regulator